MVSVAKGIEFDFLSFLFFFRFFFHHVPSLAHFTHHWLSVTSRLSRERNSCEDLDLPLSARSTQDRVCFPSFFFLHFLTTLDERVDSVYSLTSWRLRRSSRLFKGWGFLSSPPRQSKLSPGTSKPLYESCRL